VGVRIPPSAPFDSPPSRLRRAAGSLMAGPCFFHKSNGALSERSESKGPSIVPCFIQDDDAIVVLWRGSMSSAASVVHPTSATLKISPRENKLIMRVTALVTPRRGHPFVSSTRRNALHLTSRSSASAIETLEHRQERGAHRWGSLRVKATEPMPECEVVSGKARHDDRAMAHRGDGVWSVAARWE
jgi:hypothetical protein